MRSFIYSLIGVMSLVCAAGEYPAYVGASGGMLLPGNGNSFRRAAEVDVYAGIYTDDFFAWEVVGMCVPNAASNSGHGTLNGVAAHGLFHLAGWEAFDKLFGCERFDPFVMAGGEVRFGSQHAFAEDSHRTATGPSIGFGAFYHITENLDLRTDARAMMGCDSPCGILYSVVLGVQWNFGGGEE